ncbi:MAG TPA: hypothetical protein VIY48_10790 [Candidatus Paceibacterota bacterium]
MAYGSNVQRGDSETLKDLADAINATIRLAKQTQARLEVHGSVLVLRQGVEVYALGVIDNGEVKFLDSPYGKVPA